MFGNRADTILHLLLGTKELRDLATVPLTLKAQSDLQCDQMAILLVQFLAIYNCENFPNSTQELPK